MLLSRIVRTVVVLFLVTFFTSFMISLVPGSPAEVLAGEGASPEAVAAINEKYGFDKPVIERYFTWLWHALHGDLGASYRSGEQVSALIAQRLPATIELAVSAILLAVVVAIPLGLVCAYYQGSLLDRSVDAVTSIIIAIPSFLSALLLTFVFSITLGWLPVTGWSALTDDPAGNLTHAIIPTVALALPALAVFQRVLRADVVGSLQQDYITLARAKGVSTPALVIKHAFRPASFSLLTVVGIRIAELVGGTVIIEGLFSIPGLGNLLVQSIITKDLIVVQGVVLVIAVGYLVINTLVDISYRILDPRVSV